MTVTTESIDIPAAGTPLRVFVVAPRAEGLYPGILLYSDIFQLTGSTIRACVHLAGYGFVVAAPEIYHRIEPPGTALQFDDAGRIRGMENASKTTVDEFDADARTTFEWLANEPRVAANQLGATGFCIGGHLAFRAALQPECRATACFYATGLHDGKLGRDTDAGSLARAAEIQGELLMVFGTLDPHVPESGRIKIQSALDMAKTRSTTELYAAEHAFMRDEGLRYDPEAADLAFASMIRMFRRVFGS
jgi:carboxymethylenebutenolidase